MPDPTFDAFRRKLADAVTIAINGKLGDERSAHGRTQWSLALTEMDVEELRASLHQHEAAPIQVIAMGRKGEP